MPHAVSTQRAFLGRLSKNIGTVSTLASQATDLPNSPQRVLVLGISTGCAAPTYLC